MLNVTMSISTRIVNVKAALFILIASFLGVLFIQNSVFATNISSSFTNFISRESSQPASDQQATDLQEQLTSTTFNVCGNKSSYKSGAVNGKDGPQSFISLVNWSVRGAENLNATWRNQSNSLIKSLNGEVGGGMTLEYNASNDSEGWCGYIVRMAVGAGIPITAATVDVNNNTEAKTADIGAIAANCPAEFSTASQNVITTSAQISDFLYGLSDADYNNIVKKYTGNIQGQGAGSAACSDLTTALKSQIDTKVAAYCTANPDDAKCVAIEAGSGEVGVSSSCIIEGVGWIVCPVMDFTAKIVDAAYGFVSSLLKVQPILTTGGTAGIYNAWVVMRNIANLAFVIAFLFIIFSQLTSVGISNYGVKKMLPRLVIAAILVNISFWICAIAVDLSNIIGASMVQVFAAIGGSIPAEGTSNTTFTIGDNGAGWSGIVGGLLAGTIAVGAVYYIGLSALIPALLAVVVAIITVFLVLTLRQALIILLIVIAPLAFVAYLLPNTEEWFTKWRKLFMTLLLMYPIIAAIFGASALASAIVMSTSGGNIVIQIMGACIAIIPLALTPLVMKTAGGLLNRFGGIVNNADKGPIDRLRKTGEKYREGRVNMRNAKALNGNSQFGRGNFVRWRSRRGAIASGRQAEANRANTEYVAKKIQESPGFQNAVAGGGVGVAATGAAQQRAIASAISTEAKLQADEIQAAQVVVKSAQLNTAQLRQLSEGMEVTGANGLKLNGSSTAVKAAAIKSVVESNDVLQINKLWDEATTWHDEKGGKLREVFADSLQSSSARPAYIGQGAIAQLRSSSDSNKPGAKIHPSSASIIESALVANAYSPDKAATADKDELAAVDVVRRASTTLSPEVNERFVANVKEALNDPLIKTRVGKNKQNLQLIEANLPIKPLT